MIKIGTWVHTAFDVGLRRVVIDRAKPDCGQRRVVVMNVSYGHLSTYYEGELTELAHVRAKVAKARRSDGFRFLMVTWGEGRNRRVVLRAGCRFHKGVKSALARWKPSYRCSGLRGWSHFSVNEWRKQRRALNTESRRIVRTLAKELGLPA